MEATTTAPPWQVRWKRPRWDCVVLGIDDDAAADSDTGVVANESEYYADIIDELNENWTPVSSSSAVLTRREAKTAVLELNRRGKLLVRRRKGESSGGIGGRQTTTNKTHETSDGGNNNKIGHPSRSKEELEPTPKKQNSKSSRASSSRSVPSENDAVQTDVRNIATAAAANSPKSPSLTSPSSWFKSITSPGKYNNKQPTTPPRAASSKGNSQLTPPSGLFSTFKNTAANILPPPPPPIFGDGEDSPGVTNASTASSLLWEDMTLTSVSEEDMEKIRLHQQQGMASASLKGGEGAAGEMPTNRRKLFRQLGGSDLDGFDNVVLSVTIFATKTTSVSGVPTWGEVVVMELLSTKEPPLPSSSNPSASRTPSVTTSKAKGRASTSSSSSTTEPPAPPEDDEDGISNHTKILARRVLWWPSCILAARPSSEQNTADSRMPEDGDGSHCPSFVSLGRTSVWREHYFCEVEEIATTEEENDDGGEKLNERNDDCGEGERDGDHDDNIRCGQRHSSRGRHCMDRDGEERVADALDAFRSLDFLLGGGGLTAPLPAPTTKSTTSKISSSSITNSDANDVNDERKKKLTQPLSMCFVGSDGQVHFYHALRVLLDGRKTSNNKGRDDTLGLSNSFAAFLLGSDLVKIVNDEVMPLSHPRASMRLSQLSSFSQGLSSRKEETSGNPLIWDGFLSRGGPAKDNITCIPPSLVNADEYDAPSQGDWSNLSVLDASLDPTTLHLRTIRQSNVITGSCITSDTGNAYLAICGKGLRPINTHNKSEGLRQSHRYVFGGFVTFVSLRHHSESRTVYLPFAPDRIQPVYWSGMHFVMLLGEEGSPLMTPPLSSTVGTGSAGKYRCQPCVMAVRVDSAPPAEKRNISYPARFESIFVNLPSIDESLGLLSLLFAREGGGQIQSKAIAVSSIPSSPPGIILSFQSQPTSTQANSLPSSPLVVVVNHTICPFEENAERGPISLSTNIRPGHRVPLDSGVEEESLTSSEASSVSLRNVWCTGGQGWSLLGTQGTQTTYFICWDGATDDSQGPFILPLQQTNAKTAICLPSEVIPLMSNVRYDRKRLARNSPRAAAKPAPTPYAPSLPSFVNRDNAEGFFLTRSFSATLKESIKMAADIEGGLDDIIVNALDSICVTQSQSPESRAKSMTGGRANRSKSLAMTHREKSKRLLRQCSSWTQLDDSETNGLVRGQVIVATVQLGTRMQSLTLRKSVVANPISTPFDQVLSWLCQQRDYYTAASVALSLLDDSDAVYELRGIPKSSVEDLSHHKGLLDGIKPLDEDVSHANVSDTMTSLADMAIGCMIKGGTSMSKTLKGFLLRNKLFNAPRACLMLAGVLASVVSDEPTSQHTLDKNDNIMEMISTVESPDEDQIWPVRCLIKMAVVRNCLPSAILMLNATVPNELRWRAPKSRGLATAPRPPLGLFLALVDIILESSEEATRHLLNMMDEETSLPYWLSIDEDTKLAMSLISVHGKYVMVREPEVRAWVLGRLKEEIESPAVGGHCLPDGWLKEVVFGALCNSGCEIGLGLDATLTTKSSEISEQSANNAEVICYREDMHNLRDRLVLQQHGDGLDFDILIASLLILAWRGLDWRAGTELSTQTLLNTICDMAGRKTCVEPKFVFDGAAVMRQCALANNLQAAAFLIGGRKGLVLECAELVVSNLGITINDAELALSIGSLVDLKETVASIYEGVSLQQDESIFTPNTSHQHVLWLLEEHVLNVQTYGEFDSSSRKKIDPVVAGRLCFRAWYCLTHPLILLISTKWLEDWLRRKLELSNGKSQRRLACAALVRALLWADEKEDLDMSVGGDSDPSLLYIVMGFDGRFMAELAQACCGLIQSIPPHLAEELSSSNTYQFEASLINSAQ